MTFKLSINLKAQYMESMVKIARPNYQYFCNKLISMTAFKFNKSKKLKFDLPTPIDPEVQFVNVPSKNLGVTSVDHIRASYTDENPKGSLIAITVHGAPGSHFDFRYLAPPLSEAGIRVIRINMPGFGSTIKPHDFIYTPVNKINFIIGLLQAIGIDKVDIAIGHSMGCATVTALVSTHPNFASSYALLASCGIRPHQNMTPYSIVQISAKLLDVPILSKPTSAIMKKMYVRLGFDLAKTVKDEIDNCLRVCTEIDFKFHTKNLTLMGDRKLPVLLAYSLNDNMMQHAIFNEISPLMGLKTLPEMAAIEDTHDKTDPQVAYDVATGQSRQLVFHSSGHYLQKFQAKYISKALVEMVDNKE